MNLNFIKRIHLDIKKPTLPVRFDDSGETLMIAEQIAVRSVEQIEDAIVREITHMALEEGIDRVYLLDKKNIVSALKKQMPRKLTTHKVEGGKIKIGNGWWCEGTTVHKCPNCNEFISITYKYCYKCGQALDWSDTE